MYFFLLTKLGYIIGKAKEPAEDYPSHDYWCVLTFILGAYFHGGANKWTYVPPNSESLEIHQHHILKGQILQEFINCIGTKDQNSGYSGHTKLLRSGWYVAVVATHNS